jgi:hypothetical protein
MRALLIMVLLLAGCAAHEPSSTDRHNRVPQLTCGLHKVDNRMRKICCDDAGRCVFAD